MLLAFGLAEARQDVPVLAQHVMDFTNSLTFNEWRSLEDRLTRTKDTTNVHIAILVVGKLSGTTLGEYAAQVFKRNNLGGDPYAPGILIVVEKESKSAVIERGGKAHEALTDDMANIILANEILPLLKADNFYGGLAAGVLAITDAVVGKYEMPAESSTLRTVAITGVIVLLVVAGVILVRRLRKANTSGSS